MGILRFLILFFNVAVVTFLVYRMFGVIKQPIPKTKKAVILTAGIFLLIVPFAFVFRIIPLAPIYFLVYPVAVSLFIYLIRETNEY
ncbi:MAG: hypothetical protein WAZ98_03020 [Cyclobacteriaceae bacterium]